MPDLVEGVHQQHGNHEEMERRQPASVRFEALFAVGHRSPPRRTAQNARNAQSNPISESSAASALIVVALLYRRVGAGGRGSIDEPVAEADDGLDLPAGRPELGAQAADVHVHGSRLHEPLVAPYALEQPIARDDA